jgi:hypothetical protein
MDAEAPSFVSVVAKQRQATEVGEERSSLIM